MRLFWKLLLILLGVGCVPLAIASWYLIDTSANAITRAIFERHLEQASALARTVNMRFTHIESSLESYGSQPDVAQLSDAQREDLVRFILGRHGADLNVVSLWRDADTEPRALAFFRGNATDAEAAGMTAAHRAAVEGSRPDPSRAVWSDVYRGAGGEPCVTLIVPVHGTGGAKIPLQILAAEVRLASLEEEIAGTRVGPGGEAFVVDGRGRMVAGREDSRLLGPAEFPPEARAALSGGLMAGTSDYVDGRGRELLAAYAPARALGWTVFVEEPKSDALAPATSMRRATSAIALATMLTAVLAGMLFANGMSRNIRNVVTASLSIARGKFGTRVQILRKDEIGELAHTFNYMSQQLAAYDKDNKRLFTELQRGYIETIRALANSIDAKDPYTRGHSQRVTDYSVEIAREMGLSEEEVARIQFGGILHDIGKIGIKEKILGKAAPLTDEEYETMKTHPLLGVGIIDPIIFLHGVKPIIRGHHERWDGKGYPDGLKGDDIDIGARILNVADSWDAMVTQRPYNTPMSRELATARLVQIAGSQHDPKVTEAFLRVLARQRAEEAEGERWREGAPESNVVELPKRSS
jgi:HD-GYP domain-containing protein (c-di-GMP phosphodiesterase class II)